MMVQERIFEQARAFFMCLSPYGFAAFLCSSSRRRWSRSLISGVASAPKSSASNTRRTSISVPPSNGARLSHPMASSIDLTCHSQKPAINSFVSVNGPSITVRFPSENLTRTPFELARSPSPAGITPAFTSSSLYFHIPERSSLLGRTPASEFLSALTITMTLIVLSPVCFYLDLGLATVLTGRIQPLSGRRTRGAQIDRSSMLFWGGVLV